MKTNQRMLIADFHHMCNENSNDQNNHVNALAGIGDPSRFFKTLSDFGFSIEESVGFVDHQHYNESQFVRFSDEIPLLMTEKDAVKCTSFAKDNWWYLPVDAQIEYKQIMPLLDALFDKIKAEKLSRIKAKLKFR